MSKPLIPLSALTEANLKGEGVFDVLMKASRAHLDEEFSRNRIKGPEYAQVYLGSLTEVLQASVQFLLQKDKADAEVRLINQQIENAEVENRVLEAQVCKLKAEFDLLLEQKLKTIQETALLAQKKVTEMAQTNGAATDEDSVIGKQKMLYQAQTEGFKRDAEQKAAKLMADTWNVRRTTDEGTQANSTNMLHDVAVGRAITKLLEGVAA